MTQLCLPGNALTPHVLEGARFSAGAIYNGVGTMKDRGGQEVSVPSVYMQEGYLSISPSDIPAGTWNAIDSGTEFVYRDALHVSARNIMMGIEMLGLDGTATSDANATAADIVSSKIAYSKGQKLVGTIPDVRGKSVNFNGYNYSGTSILLAQPSSLGVYNELTDFTVSDPDFVPENIKSGVSIFGKTGTAQISDTVSASASGVKDTAVDFPAAIKAKLNNLDPITSKKVAYVLTISPQTGQDYTNVYMGFYGRNSGIAGAFTDSKLLMSPTTGFLGNVDLVNMKFTANAQTFYFTLSRV
ncbi:hypothetical protein ACN6KS_22540 [Paenibacillus nitricinens]|uniref:hypothetical protein n=1 Tax=Paenibacillus nitricinens TaxID=3367691 RepID=UPI003F828B47